MFGFARGDEFDTEATASEYADLDSIQEMEKAALPQIVSERDWAWHFEAMYSDPFEMLDLR